jgi:NitT/TauT family transport system ATP-binding protein
MRQRAALARTLAIDPQVLFLDEPFSALDAQTKMILQQDMARMLFDEKKTALFITHDLIEAIAMSDRLLVMSARPGTIIEEISIDLPFRDNPLERRKLPEIGPLVGRLMELLQVGEDTELH